MKPISIVYDGKVTVTAYGAFVMGGKGLVELLKPYIGLENGEIRDMNAAVAITIEFKPSTPIVTGGDAEC